MSVTLGYSTDNKSNVTTMSGESNRSERGEGIFKNNYAL